MVYPWGRSPIFYIGQASNLFRRISAHNKHIHGAYDDHDEVPWWPRYQYGAAFGTEVAWYSVKGNQRARNLEAELIEAFYAAYGSIPIANGVWPNKVKKSRKGQRDD